MGLPLTAAGVEPVKDVGIQDGYQACGVAVGAADRESFCAIPAKFGGRRAVQGRGVADRGAGVAGQFASGMGASIEDGEPFAGQPGTARAMWKRLSGGVAWWRPFVAILVSQTSQELVESETRPDRGCSGHALRPGQ